MIGADTSFLIDFLAGDEDAAGWMEEHRNVLHLCENVVYEFLCGDLSEDERETFLGFAAQFPVLAFDRDAALEASKIFRAGKDRGVSIPHPDAMIAGIYVGHGVEKLVTRNPDHFADVQELAVMEY